jgi:hypothetical protein
VECSEPGNSRRHDSLGKSFVATCSNTEHLDRQSLRSVRRLLFPPGLSRGLLTHPARQATPAYGGGALPVVIPHPRIPRGPGVSRRVLAARHAARHASRPYAPPLSSAMLAYGGMATASGSASSERRRLP